MKITDELWILKTQDEADFNSLIQYAREMGVPIAEHELDYSPDRMNCVATVGPGLGAYFFEEGFDNPDILIATDQYKQMCNEYAQERQTA